MIGKLSRKEYYKLYRSTKKSKEYQKKYQKEYRTKNKEYNKRYYTENIEKIKKSQKEYYTENKEKIKKRNRKYRKTDKGKESRKKYQISEKGKILAKKIQRKRRLSGKYKVNYLTRKCIKRGIIKKYPCEVCNNKKVDAHHEDYNKPLDIIWLCKSHHTRFEYFRKKFKDYSKTKIINLIKKDED